MNHKVAIIGGGVIGGGWAARFLLNGWDVEICDPNPEVARKFGDGLENARRALPGLADVAMPAEGRFSFCETVEDMASGAELIVEAVPENLEIKRRVYAQIEAINRDATIASSTSGILPSDLQEKLANPERLIVAHPFNPVYLLPLVELVAGKSTDPARIDQAKKIYTSIGMHPLCCRVEIKGILSDRLQAALWGEALWLMSDGVATAAELDDAIAYGPALTWAQMGVMQTCHMDGGDGGLRSRLAMSGPSFNWSRTALTDDFLERVAAQCEDQVNKNAPREIERVRDANLVALLRALKGQGRGAGRTLLDYDQRQRADGDADMSQPLCTLEMTVPLDWTDYNGHMNEAKYLEAFSKATDRFMEFVGCDAGYIASGQSYFTAETHICHLNEVKAGEIFILETICLSAVGKKLHLINVMKGADGRVLATGEQMLIHVSLETRRACPPATEIAEKLAKIARLHELLPRPEGVGRAIGQAR